MSKLSFFLAFFLLSGSTIAQITERNLLHKAYSRQNVGEMLIPLSEWRVYPGSPGAWRDAVPDSVRAGIIRDAEALINYKFEPITATLSLDYVRSGDRTRHAAVATGKRKALIKLIVGEAMEEKGRFLEAIVNGVWSVCEESYWGVPAHISSTGLPDPENPVVDLFSAETAALLGYADYFVGEALDNVNKLIRKRIYFETNRRIFTPMMTKGDSYGWMSKTTPVNNWNPWIMSNWIAATLLLEKNEGRRADMVYASMEGLDRYINGLGEDGGCDEGPSYWFAAGASVYDCLELLGKATNKKIDIYKNDLIGKMATYVYKTHIDGHYFVNFADADPKLRPDGLVLYRFGKAIGDPKLMAMGEWAFANFPAASIGVDGYHIPRRLENLLTLREVKGRPDGFEPVKDAWISDIQVMTARANNSIFLAAHGGHNAESHNHNDVGDFIIYFKGQPMIIDAGRGNYTARTFSNKRYELWFTRSEYHNLPIINGIGQKTGRKFEATQVQSTINEKEATLSMDIASAYPQEAGVISWHRVVKLNRVTNKVELSDTYETKDQPRELQQIFMTVCDVDIHEKGKIVLMGNKQTRMDLIYDQKVWVVSTEKPSTDGMEYESFKTKWDGRPVTRIIFTQVAPKKKGKSKITFSAL